MPANKKYLSSPTQKILKITSGFVGGYILMISFHNFMALIFDKRDVVIISGFTGYFLWACVLIIAFLGKNGWIVWLVYLLLAFIFSIPYLF